ncbi:hypothetical protein ACU42Y_11310 [Proteus mirabilis]
MKKLLLPLVMSSALFSGYTLANTGEVQFIGAERRKRVILIQKLVV